MASIVYTADNGTTTTFVDPTAVQAAVEAAIAALPQTDVTNVQVDESDGTVETFTPEATPEAPVEEAPAEEPAS